MVIPLALVAVAILGSRACAELLFGANPTRGEVRLVGFALVALAVGLPAVIARDARRRG